MLCVIGGDFLAGNAARYEFVVQLDGRCNILVAGKWAEYLTSV